MNARINQWELILSESYSNYIYTLPEKFGYEYSLDPIDNTNPELK